MEKQILEISAFGRREELSTFCTRKVCSARSDNGNNALLLACSNAEIGCLEYLLSKPRCRRILGFLTNTDGEGPLHVAAKDDRLDRMQLLLHHKVASINDKTNTGDTPFHFALAGKQQSAASFLLEQGADPAARNHAGQTAFVSILDNNVVDNNMREFFLEKGYWHFLAEECARNGQHSVFVSLLQYHDVQKPPHRCYKPFWMEEAIKAKNVPVANELIEHGVINHFLSPDQHNPLTLAILTGLDQVVQKLVEHGARDWVDWKGIYPVLAAVKTKNDLILSFLLNHQFKTKKFGKSAMQVAVDTAYLPGMALLLKHGEPVFGLDTYWCSPPCLKLLIASGWPLNRRQNIDICVQERVYSDENEPRRNEVVVSRSPTSLKNIARDIFRETVDVQETNIIHVIHQLNLPLGLRKIILLELPRTLQELV